MRYKAGQWKSLVRHTRYPVEKGMTKLQPKRSDHASREFWVTKRVYFIELVKQCRGVIRLVDASILKKWKDSPNISSTRELIVHIFEWHALRLKAVALARLADYLLAALKRYIVILPLCFNQEDVERNVNKMHVYFVLDCINAAPTSFILRYRLHLALVYFLWQLLSLYQSLTLIWIHLVFLIDLSYINRYFVISI